MIYHLNEVDPDDVSDTLIKLQRSLGFTFSREDLSDISTYGELCRLVHTKLQGRHVNDCSTQQAFYKVRQAIIKNYTTTISLTPSSRLETIFPGKGRRKAIRHLHQTLGFKLHILNPPDWLINTFVIGILSSILLLFINWRYGLCSLAISIICTRLAQHFAKNFTILTLGEMITLMVRDHYQQSRRHSGTLNRNEIDMVIKKMFTDTLYLDPAALTPDAHF
jgi:hypothetical protein